MNLKCTVLRCILWLRILINNNPCFFQNFALELTLENKAEFDEDAFKSELGKIGGANYGTGVRA